jgi:tripartite ATP-independent transporter DctM subunit
MAFAGIAMLVLVAALMAATGLPAYMVLIGVAVGFSGFGLAAGAFDAGWLMALTGRIVGLLEQDLLQALPLYVLMGALLNALPLIDRLFRAVNAVFGRSGAGPRLAALGVGAMLAPMNGSVGASVAALSRIVQPRLVARGGAPGPSLATICVAATLGVVVPPSLVLILLSDAMMRAHTEALNATGRFDRVINTQDMFRGALGPALLLIVLLLALTWWQGRRAPAAARETLSRRDWLTAAITLAAIVALLAAVAIGYLYAVEAAAFGAVALLVYGLAGGGLDRRGLADVLRVTMAVTGALFALFVAATSFTLVLRGFGTDRLLDQAISAIPGGAVGKTVAVLAAVAVSAFVLDAFEIIFVIVPIVMPPLLAGVPDAVWVAVLTLLVLQASFLVPPFGYAVMAARSAMTRAVPLKALAPALLPLLALQLLVLAATAAVPAVVHLFAPEAPPAAAPVVDADAELRRQLDSLTPPDQAD